MLLLQLRIPILVRETLKRRCKMHLNLLLLILFQKLWNQTKISARNLQTTQKNAFKSVTLDLVSETVESNENAPSHGEQDLRPSIATWKAKGAPSAANDPKITKKTARTAQKTALQPVTVGPLPKAVELSEEELPELPDYKPPLDLRF